MRHYVETLQMVLCISTQARTKMGNIIKSTHENKINVSRHACHIENGKWPPQLMIKVSTRYYDVFVTFQYEINCSEPKEFCLSQILFELHITIRELRSFSI